jgi:hypothetical protein
MSQSLDEKRKSLANSKADVLDARVIANYGDPGLDEDYHFDMLSRYVIVMIESAYRVPTTDKWSKLFAVVQRPKHLWVNIEEGVAASPNSQKRSDPLGNVSIGPASNFSIAGIPRTNFPYQIGELIKIKKLAQPVKLGDSFFNSAGFTQTPDSYGEWHTEGSTLPYFAGNQARIDALKYKTIYQPSASNLLQYAFTLYREQYEAFILSLASTNPSLTTHLTQIFDNSLPNDSAIYRAHGGYLFKNNNYVDMLAVEYEDINVGNKQRLSSNECMPLIVATPNTFPTPKVRSVGTIQYNPTYATIVKQN